MALPSRASCGSLCVTTGCSPEQQDRPRGLSWQGSVPGTPEPAWCCSPAGSGGSGSGGRFRLPASHCVCARGIRGSGRARSTQNRPRSCSRAGRAHRPPAALPPRASGLSQTPGRGSFRNQRPARTLGPNERQWELSTKCMHGKHGDTEAQKLAGPREPALLGLGTQLRAAPRCRPGGPAAAGGPSKKARTHLCP